MRIMRAHRRISAQRGLEIRGLNRERRKWAGNKVIDIMVITEEDPYGRKSSNLSKGNIDNQGGR